jgi:rhamnose utilization protein RhaD (predicted bifunctional aldolase and dehydrogenase)
LALRIYTTRLLGRDPKLALHGGGNTSLKTHAVDHLRRERSRFYGSKAPAPTWRRSKPRTCRRSGSMPMRRLRALEAIGDDELVAIERANLIDPAAPNPSVEIMLHAFLPHKFVDHTHATAVLSLIDQPDGAARCAEVFKDRLAFVPTSCRASG